LSIRGAGRPAALAGLVAGLALSAPLGAGPPPPELVATGLGLAALLWRPLRRAPPVARAGGLALAAALAGFCAGSARLEAIDADAAIVPAGRAVTVRGFVEAVPRRSHGSVRVRVNGADGRLLVEAPEPVPAIAVGHEVVARGVARPAAAWERGYLRRLGIATVVEAGSITTTPARRGGQAYLTDRLRERAEAALGRGTPEPQAALLRGFVLGQDDRIDPATVADFQRSGLAHLLAVSGQNIVLLALLAVPVLAALGWGARGRLLGVIALIAVYVPVAGAGPSIQRAGVMGAAGAVAVLAGRPAARWYALLLAAAATLALNPRAAGDVGWQLSFAAVIGIAVWAAPLRVALAGDGGPGTVRTALAEAAAVTVAATVATAPLMAHHFERLSAAALAANLLALPAVAPVMWLGMLAAAAGQISWLPVEPLTGLAGLFAAYIQQIAAWTAQPAWAELELRLASPAAVAGVYGGLVVAGWALARSSNARRLLRPRRPGRRARAALPVVACLAAAALLAGHGSAGTNQRAPGLQVRVLDVGQGDAILLQPRGADPVLVDAGPANGGVAERLRELGVEGLAAALITHDEEDHSGGLASVLDLVDVGAVAWGAPDRDLAAVTRAAGADGLQLTEGDVLSSGGLRLDVLWPPRELVDGPRPGPAADPNQLAVVAVARWGGFRMLLTGDAEAEAIRLEPGPVDVLKLAHHGSADSGLAPLVERASPDLAIASVGEGNPFGHPAAETMATLEELGVPLLRTDLAGEIAIRTEAGRWSVQGGE
jgi:competence protein ComEC